MTRLELENAHSVLKENTLPQQDLLPVSTVCLEPSPMTQVTNMASVSIEIGSK